MYQERLKQVVRVLRGLPQEQDLYLYAWVGKLDEDGDPRDWESRRDGPVWFEVPSLPHHCGATACALGHAGLDPWFRARGFCTTQDGTVQIENTSIDSWDAVKEFFDLSTGKAHALFDFTEEPVAPSVVADRIERFLAGEEI